MVPEVDVVELVLLGGLYGSELPVVGVEEDEVVLVVELLPVLPEVLLEVEFVDPEVLVELDDVVVDELLLPFPQPLQSESQQGELLKPCSSI